MRPRVEVRVPLRNALSSSSASSWPKLRPVASWSEGKAIAAACVSGMIRSIPQMRDESATRLQAKTVRS